MYHFSLYNRIFAIKKTERSFPIEIFLSAEVIKKEKFSMQGSKLLLFPWFARNIKTNKLHQFHSKLRIKRESKAWF